MSLSPTTAPRAVYAETKKIGLACGSSHENEAKATTTCGDVVLYARNVLAALGAPCAGPTFLASDNKANMLVSNSSGSASRSRHFLRMYTMMQERIACGDIAVGHVTDAENPADYLTKWVNKSKFKASDLNRTSIYMTNWR